MNATVAIIAVNRSVGRGGSTVHAVTAQASLASLDYSEIRAGGWSHPTSYATDKVTCIHCKKCLVN